MAEEQIIDALRQLRKRNMRSKTARLRDLFDEIEALVSNGFSYVQIVETLKKHGLDIDPRTFAVTLSRIKKERAGHEGRQPMKRLSKGASGRVETKDMPTTSGWKEPKASSNPLRPLAGAPTPGDFNHIPKAVFEKDES